MKKFIALSLIAACLGCFSLGCNKPVEKPKTEPSTLTAPETPTEKPAS